MWVDVRSQLLTPFRLVWQSEKAEYAEAEPAKPKASEPQEIAVLD